MYEGHWMWLGGKDAKNDVASVGGWRSFAPMDEMVVLLVAIGKNGERSEKSMVCDVFIS